MSTLTLATARSSMSVGAKAVAHSRTFRAGPRVRPSRDGEAAATVDLVTRQFKSDGPDQLWVADIAYIPTLRVPVPGDRAGRMVTQDRRLVMQTHLRTELVLEGAGGGLARSGSGSR